MYTKSSIPHSAVTSNNSAINEQLPQRLFARRQVIPPRHEVLWRIERGAVRTLTWSEDGTFITLGYWGPGDIVGYPLSKVKPYQIESLTSVEVSVVPPHIWYQDIDALLSHIQQAEELLSIVHRKPMSLRLWQFLVWLSEKFGCDVEKGKLLDINVTHQEIAEVLNTTRVTVTRLLQQFEEEGKLLRSKRQIILRLPNQFMRK
ncbi:MULTISPECIES: Crp/Fnr family transcriptional regulator [unclassified Tolypothrix]|uniref:Crp/Fnr family transcriptional regulator n=1 Tax=unclassified Tolypothrix TaxID=2649714 RepID=UPI0005EABACA|nr:MULTISPECIES: Crp/Fnr family transcriptional regulator [unclassified Tolypothrix]BAY94100.1 Crp/Fnr family transcriptional regulator [Microchaete diplosiphon NIES-3275]EKF03696.1 cAMP-binding protein [Tolypothrix sp. PCC 7601]MBE9085417.1 Crp/Fnr family transcriptional regulator [Tolypothrix sp. LEGE 11397]UYD27861.1 Crp/Fnr family transcriptional regulator [Tolypothrix sp. PCC 7712]UYD36273.1 Crp/Fnr family transcriptional regulator [Tolypothrix sp. PCC 7601]